MMAEADLYRFERRRCRCDTHWRKYCVAIFFRYKFADGPPERVADRIPKNLDPGLIEKDQSSGVVTFEDSLAQMLHEFAIALLGGGKLVNQTMLNLQLQFITVQR